MRFIGSVVLVLASQISLARCHYRRTCPKWGERWRQAFSSEELRVGIFPFVLAQEKKISIYRYIYVGPEGYDCIFQFILESVNF